MPTLSISILIFFSKYTFYVYTYIHLDEIRNEKHPRIKTRQKLKFVANSLNSRFCFDLYSKRILRTSFREDNNTRRRSSTNVSVPNVTGLKRGGSGVPKRRRKRRNVTGWLMHKRLPDNGKAARRFIALRASTRQGCRCRASR